MTDSEKLWEMNIQCKSLDLKLLHIYQENFVNLYYVERSGLLTFILSHEIGILIKFTVFILSE